MYIAVFDGKDIDKLKWSSDTTKKNGAESKGQMSMKKSFLRKMKKNITIFSTRLFILFILISCNKNYIEKDAKKIANLQCEAQQLMQKVESGNIYLIDESAKLANEVANLSKEMKKKYTTDYEKQQFSAAYLKAIDDCK